MKVLVTGGSGFIGSHVVEKLLERNIRVRIYDLVYPDFLEKLPQAKKAMVEYYNGSLLEEDRLRMACTGIDAVFHLAAVADVNDVEKEPRYAQNINVQGTFNVCESCRQAKTKRLIFASTVWMYQNTETQGVLKEDSPLSMPSHFYTATKFAGESACITYSKLYNVPVTILRFGIPYGPRARGTTVIALFVDKALKGQPLTLAGDGSQYRKFVYVEDLAMGCVLALKDEAKNQLYNLEGDEKITIKEIAESIDKIIGGVKITYIDGRKGDFGGNVISNEKAKKELGWKCATSFREGLRRYIDWYKEYSALQEKITVSI